MISLRLPPARARRALASGAVFSFAAALLHVVCIFAGEATARFFTAPPVVLALIRERSLWIYPVVLVIAGILGTFGLYAWSGAGRMRRLPFLRAGLVAIAGIYLLRGLLLVPQVLLELRRPGMLPWQVFLFSGVSLVIGILHAAGTLGRWSELQDHSRH